MRIVIDPYDVKTVEKAIEDLKKFKKEFETKEREFIKRLAEIGVSVAATGFALADYDGVNDVAVRLEQNGNSAKVIASGETVGFIEFGTGVRYPEWSGSAETGYTPPAHGTYGKGRGANPNGWYFRQHLGGASDGGVVKARHTYGNQPAEAMLTARNEMVERVIEIAKEVWK